MRFRIFLLIVILSGACRKPFPDQPQVIGVNVKDCGALGNGIVDDTQAFNEAMKKADSLKLPVYVPVGIYKARLVFTNDGLQMIGEKQPGDDFKDGSIILGMIDCNYKKDILIANIGIDSRKQLLSTDDAALSSGVFPGTISLRQSFKNISIIGDGYNAYKHGILCQAGSDINIRNVKVSLFYHGIAIRSGNVTIDSVAANYCGFTSIIVKSDIDANAVTQNVSISNVFIKGDSSDAYNRGGAIMITSYGNQTSITRNVTVRNVQSEHGGVACIWVYQYQGVVDNISVENCSARDTGDDSTRACYDVNGGSNINFTNCTSTKANGYGYRSTGAVTNVRVSNSFEANSHTGPWIGSYKYLQLNGVEIVK